VYRYGSPWWGLGLASHVSSAKCLKKLWFKVSKVLCICLKNRIQSITIFDAQDTAKDVSVLQSTGTIKI